MEKRVSKLVSRFKQIGDEHIRDLPIYHRPLQVEAVDFQQCAQGWIGVLITPWFMNVMLMPRDEDQCRWRWGKSTCKHFPRVNRNSLSVATWNWDPIYSGPWRRRCWVFRLKKTRAKRHTRLSSVLWRRPLTRKRQHRVFAGDYRHEYEQEALQ
jgi:hypothetical protein